MEEMVRYSVITDKNPREIVLLRGAGCRWKRCAFCDYHLDRSEDAAANLALNRQVLGHVTGVYHHLEVINSGSFPDLGPATMDEIERVCREKAIRILHFECHWMHRKEVPALRGRFDGGCGFPHEIGLFLDYPPEDVQAFIETGGEGCKLCGYWKVYHDVEAARERFACFDACRACLCRMLAAGNTISQLLCAA